MVTKPVIILTMSEKSQEFIDWLNQEMRARNWSIRNTARMAEISHGSLSNIINGAKPSFETCLALAEAFQDDPIFVMRLAHLLPPAAGQLKLLQRIGHILEKIPETDQEEIIDFMQLKLDRYEREEKERLEREKAARRQPRNAQG